MRKLSFVEDHDWGVALSDADYAQAIAAIGLMIPGSGTHDFSKDLDIFPQWAFDRWMATEAPLPWGSPFSDDWKPLIDTVSPDQARNLWMGFIDKVRQVRRPKSDQPRPLRLYFERSSLVFWENLPSDYMHLLQLFTMPEVAVDSFSLPWWDGRKRRCQKTWHWPLRVGSLPTLAGEVLLDTIKDNPAWYYDKLLRFVDPIGSDETCDLLLAPYQALKSKTKIAPGFLRSSAVLVFGTEDHEKLDVDGVLRFADAVEASAVVMLPDTGNAGEQARQFFDALTHDEPLDAAASHAARLRDGLPGPLVFSDRDFLSRTRLTTVAWQHARRMARAGDFKTADRMRSEVSAPWFGAESAGASDVARAMEETSSTVKEKPRYLQANVWAPKTNEANSEWSDAQAFRKGIWHGVETYIAELAKGATSELEPFPDLELPENQLENELRVALTAPNCVVISDDMLEYKRGGPEHYRNVSSVVFPGQTLENYSVDDPTGLQSAATCIMRLPEEGASSFGGFMLMPLTSDPVEARLSVIYENRVLQTALLRGPVVGKTEDTTESTQGIRLSPEGVVRASLEELDERRRFDAAFILNHTSSGASHVTIIKDGDIKLREVGGDISATTEIGDVLVESTNNPDEFNSIRSIALRRLLVSLALKGVKIRDHFVVDSGFSDSSDRPISRIQILTTRPEAGAPLEFVYDGYAPDDDDAKLCPNHKNALDKGECGDCPHKRGAEYVCAMRFWGMSKVIERHKYQAGLPEGDYVRINEAVGPRNAIPRPSRALAAWSKKAEDFTGGAEALKDLQATLAAVAKHASAVETWSKWRDEAKHNPSLLLMLTHTDWQGSDAVLEIAKSESLVDGRIDDRIVGKAEPARIVIILGCSTADRQRRYTSMPGRFRHAGANIVVATLTDILGRHAAPAAKELLIGLDECWTNKPKERALGDVMTRLRRRLLSKGLPIGMAIIAYGDADWRLE